MPLANVPDTGNDKVTLGILGNKVDNLATLVETSIKAQDKHGEQITALKVEQGRLDERVKNLRTNFLRIQGVITAVYTAGFAYIRAYLSG